MIDKDFTLLYQKYKEPIFSYLYYLAGDRWIAEEICQDVFLKVYLSIDKFEGRSSFKTWLYRIAKNAYLDFIKGSKKELLTLDDSELGKTVIDPSAGPESHLLNQEVEGLIKLTLKGLSEKYRTLIILRDMQNLSYQEITEITGAKLNTVKVNIYRARQEFQKIYTELEGK